MTLSHWKSTKKSHRKADEIPPNSSHKLSVHGIQPADIHFGDVVTVRDQDYLLIGTER